MANIQHMGALATLDGQRTWLEMGVTPRAWQKEALPIALGAVSDQWKGRERHPLVQAVMGAGKSLLVAALARAHLRTASTIVVTTPRAMLVRQLTRTLDNLLPIGHVGMFYGSVKQPNRQVIVACDASTEKLAKSLNNAGRTVDLWIADECHGSEADRILQWVDTVEPRARLGLTATPRRSKDDDALTLWNEVIYRYTAGDALRDGVVVPFDIRNWHGDLDMTMDDAIGQMIAQVVYEGLGPGVVDANTIDDAVGFAHELQEDYNLKASAIHSDLSFRETQMRLKALEAGELDVVVHVSMLKEGIDLPWLRWIALRRQVQSPVYFAQHVGRVLRAAPGKDRALILDPGDLFSRHSLTLEAILECDVERQEDEEPEEYIALLDDSAPGESPAITGLQADPETRFAVTLNQAQTWLRNTLTILRSHGYVGAPPPGHLWRLNDVTRDQVRAIERWARDDRFRGATAQLSYADSDSLRAMYAQRKALLRGDASDLISVMTCFAETPHTAAIFAEIPTPKQQRYA